MIAAIKSLTPAQQRELITLLEPRVDLTPLADQDMLDEVVHVLREILQVPHKDDLPEYMRRRLVDVARRHFELGENFDSTTDMQLARLIVDFAFNAAARLADDQERRAEFETFLRTKDRRERTRWLIESERFAAIISEGAFDETAAKERARDLYEGANAHRATATAILRDLGGATRQAARQSKPRRPAKTAEHHSGTNAAAGARAAGVSALLTGAGAATISAASPLAAVTGALYMAGRRKHGLVKAAAEDTPKARAQRARNSKLVQGVVSLCAFLVIHTPETDK